MDASLITNLINIEYWTGFKSSNAMLLSIGRKHWLITDGRYIEKAEKLAEEKNGRIHFTAVNMGDEFKAFLENEVKKRGIQTMNFEAHDLTVAKLNRVKNLFKAKHWEQNDHKTESKRALKDKKEIQKLQKSQQINEQVFYSIKSSLKPGITEIEVAQQIKTLAFQFGADDISFEPIIAFGPHSSIPHHENTKKKLKKGDIVLIDMGMTYQRYASDMTRTLFSKSPTKEQEQIYNLVLKAQERSIESMKARSSCKKVAQLARDIFKEENLEDKFTHSLGHGIGLEVHEAPHLGIRSTDTLKPGMVVTNEPGLYLPGKFGVRIEDMIFITQKGPQNLTKVPKKIGDCILK